MVSFHRALRFLIVGSAALVSAQTTGTPTSTPSSVPSNAPSNVPSNAPSNVPSNAPSNVPSRAPVVATPTVSPAPSPTPSASPVEAPSAPSTTSKPTKSPSAPAPTAPSAPSTDQECFQTLKKRCSCAAYLGDRGNCVDNVIGDVCDIANKSDKEDVTDRYSSFCMRHCSIYSRTIFLTADKPIYICEDGF